MYLCSLFFMPNFKALKALIIGTSPALRIPV